MIVSTHSESTLNKEVAVRELTESQMADVDGAFWAGFLCGAGIVASIAVSATLDPVARWGIYSGTAAACGTAFFSFSFSSSFL